MAKVVGTFSTFDSARNKEVFADTISMITPEETPLYSMIGTESVAGVNPRWSLDALATPSTSNARVQGDTYSYSTITATSKVANHTQIFMKEFIVAETQEAVDKAGQKSDFNREKVKKGLELRTDIEATIALNQASVAAANTVAGKLGGLRAWLTTNDLLGGSGASGGYNPGTGVVDIATNGTLRTFTKTLLDDVIQQTYTAGGNPTVLMVSPYAKRVFSSFMSDSAVASAQTMMKSKSQSTIYGAADTYISDFGDIDVVPNRQWARVGATLTRNAFLLEPGKLAVGVLRPIQEDKDVAKTSDAKPGVLKAEVTLIVKNEAALGVIADIFGLTAST